MKARRTPDPIDVAVGARVRSIRLDRGLSQSALGEVLAVTFQQVQKYENGTNRISARSLSRITGKFGVNVGDLFPSKPGSDTEQAAA